MCGVICGGVQDPLDAHAGGRDGLFFLLVRVRLDGLEVLRDIVPFFVPRVPG